MMIPRLLLVAAIPLLLAAGRGSVPNLDIKTTCHASGVSSLGSGGIDQSEDACLRDEHGAHDELVKMWPKVPAAIRETCSNEVRIGGSPSYVELLTCAQMNEWSKIPPQTAPSPAAGAKRGPLP